MCMGFIREGGGGSRIGQGGSGVMQAGFYTLYVSASITGYGPPHPWCMSMSLDMGHPMGDMALGEQSLKGMAVELMALPGVGPQTLL